MEYNIYCDESCHLENDGIKPMLLGAVWCPNNLKDKVFKRLREIKIKHGLSPRCELKWNAVSMSKYEYYRDIVDYYFDNSELHFRTLVVSDKGKLNHKAFGQTHDEFYYKMYFDLLKTIFSPTNRYSIFLDIKDTNGGEKVRKLHEVLCNNAYDFDNKIIHQIELVRSHEVELIQLADFLMGAVAYAHRGLNENKAKLGIIDLIRKRSGYSLLNTTLYREDKMNIFIWKGRVCANVCNE